MPEYPALLFVCGFHLHNRTPCALLPAACSYGTAITSVSSRPISQRLVKALCRRSDIKSVERTNVDAAVAHSCRSVRPTLSLTFSRKVHDTLQAPIDLQAEIYRIYYLHSTNGCNYRFVKPKLKLHYIFWQASVGPVVLECFI